MKIRTDFVTNSSSSSFLFTTKLDKDRIISQMSEEINKDDLLFAKHWLELYPNAIDDANLDIWCVVGSFLVYGNVIYNIAFQSIDPSHVYRMQELANYLSITEILPKDKAVNAAGLISLEIIAYKYLSIYTEDEIPQHEYILTDKDFDILNSASTQHLGDNAEEYGKNYRKVVTLLTTKFLNQIKPYFSNYTDILPGEIIKRLTGAKYLYYYDVHPPVSFDNVIDDAPENLLNSF